MSRTIDRAVGGAPLQIRSTGVWWLSAFLFIAAALGSLAAPVAQAVTITVSSDGYTGTWTSPTPDGSWGSITSPNIPIVASTDPSMVLAHIGISDTSESDPTAAVAFGVTANAGPTTFTISSALIGFAPLTNPIGITSAQMGVTSFDTNNAVATGLFPGPFSFQAQYDGGTVFKSLLPGVTAGPNSSNSVTAPTFTANVPGTIGSIQSVFSFTLSANDLASGTGRFSVPEPGTLGLFSLGALGVYFCSRRRRSSAARS